ncbi:MAG: inositol monophosphatase family protein, partial [archaeon]
MNRERELVELLKEFSIFAGKLALPFYGKIPTLIKSVNVHGSQKEDVVTVIDHSIQEMLLSELIRKNFTHLSFNGEEDTHLKFFFSDDYTKDVTLHCDPIDGTRAFIHGNNYFGVGLGLSRFQKPTHDFFSSVMYSPLEDVLYWSYQDETSQHPHVEDPPKTVAVWRSLNEQGRAAAKELGYEILNLGC